MLESYLKPVRLKVADISRESILIISTLLKCLTCVVSENHSYDKALLELSYLPNVFVLFINLGHFLIIEKDIYFILNVG